MRISRAVVAALTLAVILAPLSLARSAEAICPGVTGDGHWRTIRAPDFQSGPQTLTDYEVNALRPNVMYVTNGVEVMMTEDLGCSWESRFTIGLVPSLDAPGSSLTSEIVDLQVPESSATNNFVFLALSNRVAGVGLKPSVVGSENFGSNWRLMSAGLETAVGEPLGIHASPSSPNFVYLQLQKPGVGGDELWASQTAGQSWQRRSDGTEGGSAFDMAVDPLAANDLWFWGAGGLYHSTDGGRTRTFIEEVPAGIPLVDVQHLPRLPAQIMAYEPETGTFSMSTDGGRGWTRIRSPAFGNALSITHAAQPTDIVFSQHQGVWRYQAGDTWLDITPADYDDLFDLSADRLPNPNIYGRSYNTLHVYTGLSATADVDAFDVDGVGVAISKPTLEPERIKVSLKPRQRETVPFRLALPAEGTPLDVFFLVDTSDSQDGSIAGLRSGMQRIIEELADTKLDVQFGVGEYKDYPIPGFGEPESGDFPYRLNRAIGPADESLEEALEKMVASGGGRDQPESQLTGLYQAATGAGDPGFVPEGQDAEFRPQALKVIVHVTDAAFHDEAAHPSPPFDQVAEALREHGILQVGLSVYGPHEDDGTTDLTEMAAQTGTTAPVGVDCDGNGSIDVGAGRPLVCVISDSNYNGSLNLAPAIIATLKAVTQEVTVAMSASGGTDVLRALSPEAVPAVDVTNDNSLSFDVTFDCPPSLFGEKIELTLTATVNDRKADSSTALVACKPPPVEKRKREPAPPHLIAPAAGSLAAIIVSPPAPPPPVVENVPASQSAAQAQGAIATEPQEELQLAVARQRARFTSVREEIYVGQDKYQMSSYRSPEERSPAALYVSAAIMAAAYGALASVRVRARAAIARRRR